LDIKRGPCIRYLEYSITKNKRFSRYVCDFVYWWCLHRIWYFQSL